MKQTIHNHTSFTMEAIKGFKYIGETINNWRQRSIILYQHPTEAESVVSVGTTFDNSMVVVVTELKTAWTTALDYASRGKVYTSD